MGFGGHRPPYAVRRANDPYKPGVEVCGSGFSPPDRIVIPGK